MSDREERTIPIVEEEARLDKRSVVTGKVRVRTSTETVEQMVGGDLTEEFVEVERIPVDREVAEAPRVRTEGDVTIVPLVEEVLVVEKRLVLKEEIHLRRTTRQAPVEVPVEVRRSKAEVERE
ncbi:MAG TPA: DUF2382 domain-containing protein [Beijerinckiaceae bacterium]|nr:DUF2382 domain-containing protein [Beijerinckiaceae bacterium]